MNAFDIVLTALFLFSFYRGVKKGLFVAATSLVGVIAGVYGAIYFSEYAASFISQWFNWDEFITNLVAFAVTFLSVVTLISFAGKFLTKIADFAMLGLINKILGGIFNVLAQAFVYSVMIMFFSSSPYLQEYFISEESKESSVLYKPLESIAPLVIPRIIKEVNVFKNSQDPEEDSEI